MTVVYAIIMFCLLIFVHELGHLIAAKKCDVRVNEFSLGMGPGIFSRQRGETKYSLRAIPIGGYCAMEGEDSDSDDPRAFNKKKPWQKAIVVCAGSFMNLILTILLIAIISFVIGTATTTIGEVLEYAPAGASGIKVGDELVSIDGKKVDAWEDVSAIVDRPGSNKHEVTVLRNGKEMTFTCKSKVHDDRRIIGIRTKSERNILTAIGAGFTGTWEMTKTMYVVLKQLVTGEVSPDNLTGPVGIVYLVNKSVSHGFVYFLYLTAIISLNLAIINMLPLPALDGGRLIFIIVRKITGRAITDKIEARVHLIGMALLLLLMVVITCNDIMRFIVPVFE